MAAWSARTPRASRGLGSSPDTPDGMGASSPGSGTDMHSRDLLLDGFDRISEELRAAVDGLSPDQLAHRIAPGANPIGWLAWHLLRIQDDHVADVAGRAQVWTSEGWADRFGLDLDPRATGYGMDDDEVDRVRVPS